MNKFKTAISLCLATLMILSTVGCVSTPPENTSDSGNTSNSENNGQADNNSENTSLEIWSFYSPGTVQSDVYESIVDKYMDENPGVEVTIEFVGQDIMSKLRPRLIQKDVPDIVMLNPGYADVLASEKMLLPLDSYFDGKNYEESGTWRDDFIANTIETGAFRGNAYMVPEQLAVTAWFYNKAIFREYGLEVPETFEEFLAVCETLKENGIDPIASDGNIDYYLAWFFSSFAIREAGVEKYIAALNGEMEWTEPEFIEAARAVGANDFTIVLKYIIPNAMAPILVQFTLGIGSSILNVAGLSYIGLGVQPPTPEWGSILTAAKIYIRDAWHISVIPGIFLVVTVIAFNLFGDGLRDALDPKLKR